MRKVYTLGRFHYNGNIWLLVFVLFLSPFAVPLFMILCLKNGFWENETKKVYFVYSGNWWVVIVCAVFWFPLVMLLFLTQGYQVIAIEKDDKKNNENDIKYLKIK